MVPPVCTVSELPEVILGHNRFSALSLIVEVFIQADAQEGAADVVDIPVAVAQQLAVRVVTALAGSAVQVYGGVTIKRWFSYISVYVSLVRSDECNLPVR